MTVSEILNKYSPGVLQDIFEKLYDEFGFEGDYGNRCFALLHYDTGEITYHCFGTGTCLNPEFSENTVELCNYKQSWDWYTDEDILTTEEYNRMIEEDLSIYEILSSEELVDRKKIEDMDYIRITNDYVDAWELLKGELHQLMMQDLIEP